MEEPVKKKMRLRQLSHCIICNSDPHEYIQNKYSTIVINQLIPPSEKSSCCNKNIFKLCVVCLGSVEELIQLQYSLDFITKSIKKKKTDIKCKILQNRMKNEQKDIKTFRDIATRSLRPTIQMCKKNALITKRRNSLRNKRIMPALKVIPTNCKSTMVCSKRRISAPATLTSNKKPREIDIKKINGLLNISGGADTTRRAAAVQQHKLRNSVRQKSEVQRKTKSPIPKEKTPIQKEKTPIQKEKTLIQKEKTPIQKEKTPIQKEKTPIQKEKTPIQKEKLEPSQNGAFKLKHNSPCSTSSILPQATSPRKAISVEISTSQTVKNITEPVSESVADTKQWPKPPLTYVQLCVLAIMSQENMCLIGRDIYGFLKENFPYFKQLKQIIWISQVRNALRTKFFWECPERRYVEPFCKSGLKVFSVVESEILALLPRIDKFMSSEAMLSSMEFPERLAAFKNDLQKKLPPNIAEHQPTTSTLEKTPVKKEKKEKKEKKVKEVKEGKVVKVRKKKCKEEQPLPQPLTEEEIQPKDPHPPNGVVDYDNIHEHIEAPPPERVPCKPETPKRVPCSAQKVQVNELNSDEQEYTPNGLFFSDEMPEQSNVLLLDELRDPSAHSAGVAFNERKDQVNHHSVCNEQQYMPSGSMYNEVQQGSSSYDNNKHNMSNGYVISELKELPYETHHNSYQQDHSTIGGINNSQFINCMPVNNYLLTCEELCVVAIMNVESMLVSASDVYDFIIENFPSFYNTDIYAQLPYKNFIKTVLSQTPFYFFAKWSDQNFFDAHSAGYADVYQMLYTVIYNYSPDFRKMIASKLSSKENMAIMAFSDRVYAFIQNVLEKPVVPDFNRYIHQKMQTKMISMEYPSQIENQMVESNNWVQAPTYTNANFQYTAPTNSFPSTSTMLHQ